MMEFTQNDWGQREIIKSIMTLKKRGITQPQYSDMKKDIT